MLAYGIHRSIVDRKRSFLPDRTFLVRAGESYSAPVPTCSGVPQGSVLGPILFVNDLPEVLSGSVLLFADDVKLISARSQYKKLHQNLQTAFQWSENCDLPLNAAKYSHVAIGGPPPFPLTLIDGTAISSVDSTKDLGVTVTSTFTTSLHCQQPVNRARRVLFQLRRGFAVLTPEIFRPLYLALVRLILEYGQQASSPYLQHDIALMERLQRLATRTVKDMRELPYVERLRRLNLFSLERHRLRGDLILAYTVFHRRLDFPHAEFFEAPAERNLRGHDFKKRHRSFRLLRRKAAYSVRLSGP